MQMPLPPIPPATTPHYTLSTKQKKPRSAVPPEPANPPPPSKPPCPEPKPQTLKSVPAAKKNIKKQFSRRRRDVYIPDSESDEEPPSPPTTQPPVSVPLPGAAAAASQKAKKPPYANLEINDDEHMYDEAEVPEEAKQRARKMLFVQRDPGPPPFSPPSTSSSSAEPPPPPSVAPPPASRVRSQYQNVEADVTSAVLDPPYDQNPSFPPLKTYPPYEDAPVLPPRAHTPVRGTVSSPTHSENYPPLPPPAAAQRHSHGNKKLPQTPPTAAKPPKATGPTPPVKFSHQHHHQQQQSPSSTLRLNPAAIPLPKKSPIPPPVLSKPDKSPGAALDELSEQLSSILASRNAATGNRGGGITPGGLKKQSWKRGEPQLPPAGGMTNFI